MSKVSLYNHLPRVFLNVQQKCTVASLETDQRRRSGDPVDRSFEDLFRSISIAPIQFVEERRSRQGSTLSFSISEKMGFVSTPIKGTIEVTDRGITINADLGLLDD